MTFFQMRKHVYKGKTSQLLSYNKECGQKAQTKFKKKYFCVKVALLGKEEEEEKKRLRPFIQRRHQEFH